MADPHAARRLPLSLEGLEVRELLAATPWLVEPFQRGPVNGLPSGWNQWASNGTRAFQVDPGPGLGDAGHLSTDAGSNVTTRAWLAAPYDADVETSAAVYLSTTVPVQLFVRGRDLNTTTPSYYAVSVTRGAEVQLVKVVRGQPTILGTVRTDDYLSAKWATIRIRAEGDRLRITLHRGDTNQYLAGDGSWTRQPTAVIETTDTAIRGGGQVGFARPAKVAGKVSIDSLRVGAPSTPQQTPLVEERFARAANTLPAGWSQWSAPARATFATVADETLRIDAGSTSAARAFLNNPTTADSQISSSIFVDSLVPAGIFARGSNLSGPAPTYYGLTVTRGLEVKLSRVVNGTVTELGIIRSQEWLSGLWVQASLVLNGDKLRVQLYRSDTGQYLNPNGTWSLTPVWAMTKIDTTIRSGGRVGLSRGTDYAGPLVFDNFIVTTAPGATAAAGPIPTEGDKATTPRPPEDTPTPTPTPTPSPTPTPTPTPLPSNPALPTVPRHYDWIRLANLAYYGTPIGATEKALLRNSIDIVIPNITYLDDVSAVAPQTPQFIYTNISNIYLGLLTDWNEYADRNRLDREGAFYHVTRATTFNGSSASSIPVNRFWGVHRGSDSVGWIDLTGNAGNTTGTFAFADNGQAITFGFLEKFRELNIDLRSGAAGNWRAQLEYVSAVDATGKPTAWKALSTVSDTTGGLRRDGQVTFDPPRDWVAASVNSSARMYYVRFRTTAAGTAPHAISVLGRDYTRGNTIPAFDASADRDRDGYLSDAEYTRRRSGFDARFKYETRLFYPNYGTLRFATNVSDPGFRAWAANYHSRVLRTQPLARGFFVDNSIGRLAVDSTAIAERLDGYSADYGSLLGAVNKRLASDGKWLIANTAGGGVTAEPIVRNGVSFLEEYALRPVSSNHVQFDDLAAMLTYRRQLSGGRAYEILDTLPQGFDANDTRVQLASLAMYYMLADPQLSLLMVNGGNEPASSWSRHWIEAVTYDVGRPLGTHTIFATGSDPTNTTLQYKVYQRKYENAVVLYKPLSYTRGQSGTTTDATATLHRLDGWYRAVKADGTLGAPVREVRLRNGEGVILAKVA